MSTKHIIKRAVHDRLAAWARIVNPSYEYPAHLQTLCTTLESDFRRLIIEMPPRHGKTETTSIAFASWYLCRNPDKHVILASHTAILAYRNSRRARNAVLEHGKYFFDVDVAQDSAAVNQWSLKGRRGGLVAAGVGGPITGAGADLLIIDDPIKDAVQAYSAKQRETVWEWYAHVARTRLNTSSAQIVVMNTRWHEDDLTGRLLSSSGEAWDKLSLPAVSDDDKPLWPERFSLQYLNEIKSSVGSTAWNALYQQRPTSEHGNIIQRDWIHYCDGYPLEATKWVVSWDMSFKETADGSYVVGTVWCRHRDKFYLVEKWRKRAGFVETLEAVKMLKDRFPASVTLIEEKANGAAIMDAVRDKIGVVVAYSPRGSKEARLRAVEPMFERGDVLFLRSCTDISDMQDELLSFPRAPHDDQVDSLTMALDYLTTREHQLIDLDI